jgi:hypothetical protein
MRRLIVAVACVATAMTWLTPATVGSAQTVPGPTLTVTPDHELVDGQSVLVEGAGFGPYSVAVLQCRPGSTSLDDVLANCEIRSSRTPDASGSLSVYETVEREVQPMSGPGPIDCTSAPGACTLAVAYDTMQSVVEVPLAFADPEVPVPTLTVTPSTGLDDGDTVQVGGAGFTAGAEVTVMQCQNDRPLAPEWCDTRTALAAIADPAGAIAGGLTIRRAVTIGSGQVVDCAGTGCVVAASTGDGQVWAAAPIELIDRRVLAAAFGPHTVTPLGTVHVTGWVTCTEPRDVPVEIQGTITQVVEDRTITAEFSVAATCGFFNPWEVQVVAARTQRFKVGPAAVTTWANEVIDPFPDDASAVTVDVDLVRPTADPVL